MIERIEEDASCDRCGSDVLLELCSNEVLCLGCINDEAEARTDGAEEQDF